MCDSKVRRSKKDMNVLMNRLDNLCIDNKSYEFIPESIKKEMNINGMIVGVNGQFLVDKKDAMILIKKSNLKNQIGQNMYDALIRKPMMVYLIPTMEDEFEGTKQYFDERYGIKALHLNNFAQSFSIGCWFIKDSCVTSTYAYWINLLNGYNSQFGRDMGVTLSDGAIAAINLSESEMVEAIERMYEVYRYLLPEESKTGRVDKISSVGTTVWEVDKAISKEGNSFARALIILQEARRTGVLASKIDKYCSILECLYAIKKNHKKNISSITAAYIGKDDTEREEIIKYMREAYGVRSDSSHGDNLKYLKENDEDCLKVLSSIIDDYVRRVFRKVIRETELNYDNTDQKKAKTREYFRRLTQSIYPE